MRTSRSIVVAFLGIAVGMTCSPVPAVVFLSDDFEYVDDAAMAAAGWLSQDTETVTEIGGQWKLMLGDGSDKAHYNPPTIDGSPSSGQYVISSSWGCTGTPNIPDTGASHDLYTKSFSTVGHAQVWLHADVAAMLNQNGHAIFDIEVSTNGGTTWNSAFHRVCPDRGEPGCFCDIHPPIMTFPATNEDADGFHGHLDLDLSPWAANAADVQVRFRHYEPALDWWIRMDNVRIDSVPVGLGNVTAFEENFSRPADADSEWVGDMIKDGDHESGQTTITWVTTGAAPWSEFGQYVPGEVGGQTRRVNRLEHYHPGDPSDPVPNSNPDFALIDCVYASWGTNSADEYLMTPLLDLSSMVDVRLSYQDEVWWFTKNGACTAEVLLMRDIDQDGPDRNDQVVEVVFSYDQDAIGPEDGEEPWYAERLFSVPEAAGADDMFFAWHYDAFNAPWWAIDSIKVTGSPGGFPGDANRDGKVDDEDAAILAGHWHMTSGATWADGDFNGDDRVDDKDASILAAYWHYGASEEGDTTVPEPSTLIHVLGAMAAFFIVSSVGQTFSWRRDFC